MNARLSSFLLVYAVSFTFLLVLEALGLPSWSCFWGSVGMSLVGLGVRDRWLAHHKPTAPPDNGSPFGD